MNVNFNYLTIYYLGYSKLSNNDIQEIVRLLKILRSKLISAVEKLEEASKYSILDILLGGSLSLIADIFEYSRFYEAKLYAEEADDILREIRRRINELNIKIPEIDNIVLWAIADIGLDNLIIDLIRHYKINQAKEKLLNVISQVDILIRKLEDVKQSDSKST